MDELDNDRIDAQGTTPRLRLRALQYALAQRRGDTILMARYNDLMQAEQRRIDALCAEPRCGSERAA